MDKAEAQEHLAEADRNIEKGKDQIRKQEERVEKLAADGHATKTAERTLKYFQELERTMEKHRDMIRNGVKKSSSK
jgi:hypothetical protein